MSAPPVAARAWIAALTLACAVACSRPGVEDARVLQEEGRHAEAVELLKQLVLDDPDDPDDADDAERSYLLGVSLHNLGRFSEAVWPLRRAEKDAEFAHDAAVLLGLTFFASRNYEAAADAARRALAVMPEDAFALSLLGESSLGAHRPQDALEAAERFLELLPSDPAGLATLLKAQVALEREDEAAATMARLEATVATAEPWMAGMGCLGTAEFLLKIRRERPQALAKIEECVARHGEAPGVLALGIRLLDAGELRDDASRLLREQLERDPDDSVARVALAQRLAVADPSEAESVLLTGIEREPRIELLAELASLRRGSDPQGALEALDRALALEDSEWLRFVRADLLAEIGRLEEAEAAGSTLQEPIFRDLVSGRVALERGEGERAQTLLEAALTHWPDNAGARLLAARAARVAGDDDATLSHLREAARVDETASDAALLLARLYLVRGEPEQALVFATQHVQERDRASAEARLIAARAAASLERWEGVDRSLDQLEALPGQASAARAERIRLTALHEGIEPAEARLAAMELSLADRDALPVFEAYVAAALALDEAERAEALLANLEGDAPAELLVLRAQVRLSRGDLEAAQKDLRAAQQRDPESAAVLATLGSVSFQSGDPAAARDYFERAALRDPANPDARYGLAQLALASGDAAGAEEILRALLETYPEHAGAANDLAWLLAAESRELELALALAQRARRATDAPEVLDTLGYVHLRSGRPDPAREAFEAALRARPGYGSARYHLALALLDSGERDAARRELETALAGGPFGEQEAARETLRELTP